jgi:putative membrane protein
MRIVTIIAALAGLLLGTSIVAYYGFSEVIRALLAVGWGGFAAICAFHLALYGLLGLAWRVIVPSPAASAWTFVWGRLIRDSGSEVLPLSQLGGFVMGARAATIVGLPAPMAFASTIVVVTLEVIAQIAYTALGIALLARQTPESNIFYPLVIGLALAAIATVGFIVVQHRGLALIERLAKRSASRLLPRAIARGASVQSLIHAIYGHPRGLSLGLALHLVGWIGNGMEAYLALHFMGIPIGLGPVLAIESLLYAVRSAAFAVPNAVGVQEGAYIILGGLFGLAPEIMLALSLLKRARDVIIGVPSLLAWQALESGHLWRDARVTADARRSHRDARASPQHRSAETPVPDLHLD